MQTAQSYSLPPEIYAKALHFAQARHALHFAGLAFSLLVLFVIWRSHAPERMRSWPAPVYFVALLTLVAIFDIPLDATGHGISLHFGISKQSWPSWFWDWTKEQIITVAIGTALAWPLYALMRRRRRDWWLIAWAATLPLMVLGTYADPLIFEPLFNHFTPLAEKHPELIPQIEQLLHHSGVSIPPDHLFEMSASEKTNALNAYVSGFGPSRRLVLYDTIIRQEEGGPLLTTIGHELGHYVLQHIPKGMAFAAVGLLAGFYLVHLLMRRLVGDVSDRASFPVLLLVAALLGFFSEPIGNAFSRMQEKEADLYSLEVTHGILPNPGEAAARAFQVEGQVDLDVPNPDPFIVFWLYSHPPTSERYRYSLDYDPWRNGEQPRFVR